jgi:hypothetical protein
MINEHRLNPTTHSDFLKQKRIDPITGEKIEEGHTIVICAACKSAFFIESWEYLGNTHCSQEETLSQIPVARTLQLAAKPLEYLPFYFRKGKYILDRGDGGNSIFAVRSFLFILGIIAYFPLLITTSVYLGKLLTWEVGFVFTLISIWLTGEVMKPYYKGKRKFSRITYSRGIHLAVNMKNQMLEYKKKNKQKSIPFDKIKHIKYYIDYIPFHECGQYLQQAVSIEITTIDHKKTRLYTFLHKNQMPQWSKFLEELPYNLSVLNQK